MRKARAIKRFFLTLMWLGVAAGMGTVITAAMRAQEAGKCKGYNVHISGFNEDMLFTSEEQVVTLLKAAAKGNVEGQLKSEFDLPAMEDLLEQSSWVYNADLYFDNNNVLHANVTERKPLARVFNTSGASFYIDEAGKQIPLSEKVSLDLPVFTGYPAKKVLDAADSTLVQNVIATASFISSDPFWNAQVAQIDISKCGKDCWSMSMIPVVGSHKVDLGDGSDISSKFHRLYLFYDQVLKRTGFDKYHRIDVQYGGQVIGVKGDSTKVDPDLLRKNIENLLQQSREYNEMVQLSPKVDYTAILEADSLTGAAPIFNEDDGFVTEEGSKKAEVVKPVVEHKAAPVVAATPAKKTEVRKATSKPADVRNETKPVTKAKTAPVKTTVKTTSASNTAGKRIDEKKASTKKPAPKAPLKTEAKKAAPTKKAGSSAQSGEKRNLLVKETPEKKTEKKSPAKKTPAKNNR